MGGVLQESACNVIPNKTAITNQDLELTHLHTNIWISQQPTAFPRPAVDYHTIPRHTSSDCACLMSKASSDKKWYKGQWVEKYDNMQTYFIWLPINLLKSRSQISPIYLSLSFNCLI